MNRLHGPFSLAALLAAWLGAVAALGQPTPREYRIAVVPKGANQDYWEAIHAGALQAKRELETPDLKIDILWKGNAWRSEGKEQIQIVDNFTGRRLSGILVASLEESDIEAQLASGEGGLPFVYLDSSLRADQAVTYVAVDNFQAGAMAADRLGQLLEGEGNVILFRHESGNSNTEAREAGFLERLKRAYPDIRLLSIDQYARSESSSAYQGAEYLLNRYGRRVNGIFASSELGAEAMLDALRDFGYAGQVFLVGYNANPETVQALRDGRAHGLLVMNPFEMGYLGVATLVENLQGRNIPTMVESPVTLLTPGNLDSEKGRELLRARGLAAGP